MKLLPLCFLLCSLFPRLWRKPAKYDEMISLCTYMHRLQCSQSCFPKPKHACSSQKSDRPWHSVWAMSPSLWWKQKAATIFANDKWWASTESWSKHPGTHFLVANVWTYFLENTLAAFQGCRDHLFTSHGFSSAPSKRYHLRKSLMEIAWGVSEDALQLFQWQLMP